MKPYLTCLFIIRNLSEQRLQGALGSAYYCVQQWWIPNIKYQISDGN